MRNNSIYRISFYPPYIHPTPTIQSAYQPKLLFPAKVVGADVEKAPSDFLLAITYHLAI